MCVSYGLWIAGALYVLVALIWLMPDRRIERTMGDERDVHTEAER